MFGLRKDVRILVNEITTNLKLRYGHERILDLLTKENRRLREENRSLVNDRNKLLDRLMAKDFTQYSVYTEDPAEEFGTFSNDSKNESLEDEANIGEVIEE